MLANTKLTRFVACWAPAGCVAVALAWFLVAAYPPAEAQQAAATTVDPVLKVYLCPPAVAQTLAARLRDEFSSVPGVRIGADDRLGQVLVQAPPEIQAQVARYFAPPPANVGPQQSPQDPPAVPRASSPRDRLARSVQLRHATARQIEEGLVSTLGNRLTPVPGGGLVAREYRLGLPGGGGIDLSIDHQAHQVTVQGTAAAVDSCVRLIQAMDSPGLPPDRSVRLLSLRMASPASVRQVAAAIGEGAASGPRGQVSPAALQPPAEQREEENGKAGEAGEPGPPGAALPPADGQAPQGPPQGPPQAGLIGPVQIEMLEGLDVLVVSGHQRDVDRVMEIIQQVEKLSAETEPVIVVHRLQHVNCEALAALITPLYQQVYEPRQGGVSITALVKPNALLLIGRRENVQTVQNLVKRLDQPVASEAELQVFALRHAAATAAQTAITQFFGTEPTGLATRVVVTADYRSNALIVRAGPRDMLDVAKLIERIDTPTIPAVNELRVFELYNSRAEDLEQILEEAIGGQAAGPGAGPGAGAGAGAAGQQAGQKSAALQFLTIDRQGQRRLRSGILTDVRITSNPSANTLVVSGPADGMDLLEAVIRQLDQPPVAEAQIKVFNIVNGDAPTLRAMLDSLFAATTGAEPAAQTAAVEGESSLVSLRFVEDVRTNTIIASGTAGDLLVVDAILMRLDEREVRQQKTEVYRLKNAPAADVATAVNSYLTSERSVMTQISPEMMSAFQQIEREVVVVAEPVSNSLIVSATPRFFEAIMALVKDLDERPPMVMIEVLIAEVMLNDTDEFGVELGLQDSVLFDRSLLEVLSTITTTTTEQTPGMTTSTETQEIVSANNTPGFAFNNQPLGNAGSAAALEGARILGSQGLSTFAVNRINSELGYGGLVLSASNDVASILIRALKENRRLDVLSRPQIQTLDNQPAWIMVGQSVPMVRSVTTSEVGQTFNTQPPEEVGLILGVWPRISPDNVVVMEINAEKSEVGPEAEGIPVSISATGVVVRTPRINRTSAQTTVSAADGQTVVLGGLITKSKAVINRKVPCLGDIPVLGALFRFDGKIEKKTELLIILTPRVVRTVGDAEAIKQVEAARMSWCLSDVLGLTSDSGLRGRTGEWSDSETNVVYPDLEPNAEPIPVPGEMPGQQPIISPPNGSPSIPESTPGTNSTPQLPAPAGPAMPGPQVSSAVYPARPFGGVPMYTTDGGRPAANDLRSRLPAVQQVQYQPRVQPGAGQQPAHPWAGRPAYDPYSGPGSTIPLGYDSAPPPGQWPVAPPGAPYQPPAAPPTQYIPSYEPPTAQPTQQTPSYR